MPIYVRIVTTYPADSGSPEETFDVTYRLRSDFASTPAGAHMRIVAAWGLGADGIAFPVADSDYVEEFNADVLREVWVW